VGDELPRLREDHAGTTGVKVRAEAPVPLDRHAIRRGPAIRETPKHLLLPRLRGVARHKKEPASHNPLADPLTHRLLHLTVQDLLPRIAHKEGRDEHSAGWQRRNRRAKEYLHVADQGILRILKA